MTAAASLILNSPYAAPTRHWTPDSGGALVEAAGRRPASYEIFDIRNNTRRSEALDKVNEIRGRVDAWRAAGYPGATAVSRRLLEHWHDATARVHPFYFCQLEAIETLIWWVEGSPEFRQGAGFANALPGDGGPWERVCSKMATGTGKTLVMGMIVVWQAANALAYPKRKDFSRAIFVVAPGLTVKERLRVLYPGEVDNVYDEFGLCPSEALRQQINRAEILVDNWHALMPLAPPERSVVNKGRESDEAFARRVLGKLATHKNLVVINDEAHHAGQDVQKVISVAMLSEGWDAKNVTQIMGLRAFTSQLLCEQVIGRGLRRVSHDLDENGLFKPEYVNIFGVPLSIFQEVGAGANGEIAPPPPKPSTQIEALPERNAQELRWPNVLRVDTVVRPTLVVDWNAVPPLTLDPAQTPIIAEIAPALGGAADMSKVTRIDLEVLPESFRLQRLMFRAAQKAFEQTVGGFAGQRDYLALQLIRLVEQFLSRNKLDIPSLFHQDETRKRILIALNLDGIVQHLMRHVEQQNRERLEPVFDGEQPLGSTRVMRTWYTTKTCHPTQKSQISHMLADSAWEQHAANLLEMDEHVMAYAKNDHLGFQIVYL